MESTSSAISAPRSQPSSRERWALVLWLALTGILVATASRGRRPATDQQLFFDYEFAIGSTIVYGFFVLVTLLIARLLPDPPGSWLRAVAARWIWIALGLSSSGSSSRPPSSRSCTPGRIRGSPPRSGARAARPSPCLCRRADLAPFAEELLYRGLGIRVLAFARALRARHVTRSFRASHGLVAALPLGLFAVALGWVRLRSESSGRDDCHGSTTGRSNLIRRDRRQSSPCASRPAWHIAMCAVRRRPRTRGPCTASADRRHLGNQPTTPASTSRSTRRGDVLGSPGAGQPVDLLRSGPGLLGSHHDHAGDGSCVRDARR